ncbi:MAG: hypothetical protein R2827_16175, partial [Bdellovibrionales bacterium]
MNLPYLFVFLVLPIFVAQTSYAACGGTTRTWSSSAKNTRWDSNSNWVPANQPNTTSEDAVIVSSNRVAELRNTISIGCMEVQSGQFISRNSLTLTITGDYLRAINSNTLIVNDVDDAFWFELAGTSAQTIEIVDPIQNLRISNNSTVTLTQPFTIDREFILTGTTTQLYIDANLTLDNEVTTPLTIPSGVTVELRGGATLFSKRNIIVNGSLVIGAGSSIVFDNGFSLTVNSGGTLDMDGASGSVATITSSGSGSSYGFNMAGLMNANYFRIDRLNATGLNVTGNVQSMDNGEFHYLANSGAAITIGASASMPSVLDSVGFFDDDAYGNVTNVNASSYNGSALSFENWSGGIAGTAYENDPNGVINWSGQSSTYLYLSDNTESGNPPATVLQSSTDIL